MKFSINTNYLPQPICSYHIKTLPIVTTLKYTLIMLANISYLCGLVVRAVHQHRTGVGLIPAGAPYSYEFLNCSQLEFEDVHNFHSIVRHIYHLENFPHRVKCHKIKMIYPQPICRHYHTKIHINYSCSHQLSPYFSDQSSALGSHRCRFDSCWRTL